MKEMTLVDIKKELTRLKKTPGETVRIAVLRNITIESFEDYIKFYCAKEGISAQVRFSAFDNIYQDVVSDTRTLIRPDTDVVFFVLKLENISRNLSRRACGLTARKACEEKNYIVEFVESVCKAIRKKSNALIIFNLFEYPVYSSYGILDYQGRYQKSFISELNESIMALRARIKGLYFLDTNVLLSRIGTLQMYDDRYWHMAQAPYGNQALSQMAQELFKYIRALKGKSKKCLILDCDNTLWGGVIGEDGLNNIKLGREYPGSCYYELQEEIINLYHRGVLLALNSKNNERDVWEVFNSHPHMLLQKKHLCAYRVNWLSKPDNIKSIAKELNIGLESIVFLDDNPFECGMVRKLLPRVTVIQLPKETTEFRNILVSSGVFDSYILSDEDKQRTKMYREEKSRQSHAQKFSNIAQYLRSLRIELVISRANSRSVARIAQLTQRTNQFNFTVQRYSESQIEAALGSKDTCVWQVNYKDRFGDAGIVGTAIVLYQYNSAIIDSFLLSCRVLGRGVEEALLYHCASSAKKRNCKKISIRYKKTEKNSVAKDFLTRLGLTCLKRSEQTSVFTCALKAISLPDFFYRVDFAKDEI